MRKLVIGLTCALVCIALCAGCADKEDSGDQDTDLTGAVEVDIPDGEDNADEAETDSLPDGLTYDFKDPDNAAGIVVEPKE